MAGHSRWAQIKHQKAGSDARRGAVFSKLARLITVAAREGGPNPAANPKLRSAIDQARAAGLPKENIERAIARASGEGKSAKLSTVEYEAYGPGGMALLITGVTDNPNRTTSELRRLVASFGGRLAEAGSVTWLFEERLLATFSAAERLEELELALIDAGAEDTRRTPGALEAIVAPERREAFLKAIAEERLTPTAIRRLIHAKNPLGLDPASAKIARELIAALEDHGDVTGVVTNLNERAP